MKGTSGFLKSIWTQIPAKRPLITDIVVPSILMVCPTLFTIFSRMSLSKSLIRIYCSQIQANVEVIEFVETLEIRFPVSDRQVESHSDPWAFFQKW